MHQLSLGRLLELDGRPAQMAAGDLLVLAADFEVGDPPRMTLVLADEPVAEPPPGLFTTLTRTELSGELNCLCRCTRSRHCLDGSI